MICSNCGAEVTKGNAFCSECGTAIQKDLEPQSDKRKCSNFGNIIEPGLKFK